MIDEMMKWIPVTDRMPKASDEMTHDDDVLVYLPPRDVPPLFEGMEPIHFSGGIYLGHPTVTPDPADEKGESNFWGIPIEESDWTIWGYSYFMGAPKPTHWMPLPEKPDGNECRYETGEMLRDEQRRVGTMSVLRWCRET